MDIRNWDYIFFSALFFFVGKGSRVPSNNNIIIVQFFAYAAVVAKGELGKWAKKSIFSLFTTIDMYTIFFPFFTKYFEQSCIKSLAVSLHILRPPSLCTIPIQVYGWAQRAFFFGIPTTAWWRLHTLKVGGWERQPISRPRGPRNDLTLPTAIKMIPKFRVFFRKGG